MNNICTSRRRTAAPAMSTAIQMVESLEARVLFSRLLGLDVSNFQPNVNWASVHSAGKSFTFFKATEGTSFVDNQFARNTGSAGAEANGLYAGFYHFARYDTGNSAVAEADHFWSVVASRMVANGKTLMPMLDVEEGLPSGWTTQTLTNWINGWCNEVKSKAAAVGLSVTPMVYMNISTMSLITADVAVHSPLVVAQWPGGTVNTQTGQPSGTGQWQDWAFWQYADNGHVAGVGDGTTTNVDLDVFNGDSKIISDFVIGGQGTWADGTWVKVNTSSGLKAWNDPTSDPSAPYSDTATVIPNGTYGKILQGPVYGNGYMRWQIQYNNGVTGWSAEPFLISATPSVATNAFPANGALINALPSFFTWSAANASSYKVYLDGVLKANVNTASWSHIPIADGTHTWRIDSINDGVTTTGTTWSFTLDTVAPTASFGGQTPVTGSSAFDFTVTYADATSGLDTTSLDNNDITVTGPGGYSTNATFISLNGNVATYEIAAPGGTWDLADDGTYTITQNASQVRDLAGNYRLAGSIGTFNAAAPFAYLDGSTLRVEYAPSVDAVTMGNDGAGNLTATENGTTLSFAAGSISDVLVSGVTGANNSVTIAATLGVPLALNSASGNDSIEVQSGAAQSFATDAGASNPNLTLIVDSGASAVFSATQHLAGLTINGTAQVASGSGATLVTMNLAVTGSLDLTDNDMIIVGGDPGTFSGSAYTGVTGLLASGAVNSSAAQVRYTTLGAATAGDALSISGAQTATFDGQTVSPGDVLVKYTYVGDANLDGKVNIDDYGRIDGNVGQSGLVFGWFNGDFNYDGKINIDDYGLIDGVIGSQGPVL